MRGAGALTSDVRLDVFAVVFALGTLLHELEFAKEVAAVGPLTEYMERWGRVVPTTGWPSSVGIAAHLANVGLSLYLLTGRRRREGLCLLAVTFLLSQLVSPNRIASHNSLMFGGLVVVLVLSVGEWTERARALRPRIDWYGWTLAGLAWICALTYFFALLYKLNSAWFSPRGPGPIFLTGPFGPILDRVAPPSVSRPILAALAIYGTLLIELILPALLFHPRTRRLGCLVGAIFHFPMVLRGVTDFPVLILAFFPAFLGLGEMRDLLARLARPRIGGLIGAGVLAGIGIWAVSEAPKVASMTRGLSAVHPLVALINTALTYTTTALLAYLIVELGGWLTRPAPPPAGVRIEHHPSTAPAVLIFLIGGLFAANQLAPFVGLPRAGALVMYSGIAPDMSNHALGRGISVNDSFGYVSILDFEPTGIDTPPAREFGAFARASQRRGLRVHLNVVRYHMNRVCRSAAGGTIRLRLGRPGRDEREIADVCADGSMRWYVPIPIGAECSPSCGGLVHRWARGRTQTD